MTVKSQYKLLLEDGEFEDRYPGLSGLWEKDKEIFTMLWQQEQDAINYIDVNYDEFE